MQRAVCAQSYVWLYMPERVTVCTIHIKSVTVCYSLPQFVTESSEFPVGRDVRLGVLQFVTVCNWPGYSL